MSLIDLELELGIVNVDLEIGLINIDLAILGPGVTTGTAGEDHTAGSKNADVIETFGGDDVIFGSSGIDIIDGGLGFDTLIFDFAGNRFTNPGVARDITITDISVRTNDGGLPLLDDVQTTMLGIDRVVIRLGEDVNGNTVDTNDDSVDASLFSGSGGVQIYSGGGTDDFKGSLSDDVFSFQMGAGTNTQATADGGAGSDAARILLDIGGPASYTYTESGNIGHVSSSSGESISLTSVERVAFSGRDLQNGGSGGPVTLDASDATGQIIVDFIFSGAVTNFDADLTVFTGAGNDIIQTNAGDDYIRAGAGDDRVNAGAGNDTISYADAESRVTVSLARQDVGQETRGAGRDILFDFENLEGSVFNDYLRGDGQDNTIRGLEGNDKIAGSAGNDLLIGEAGNDRIAGGDGDDSLRGNSGDDGLRGGNGADRLAGGEGNDRYVIDDRFDTVVENAGEGTDTVFAALSYRLDDHVENLRLRTGHLDGTGNNLDNEIDGGVRGNNVLKGLGGDDIIHGGMGRDQIFGGNGRDAIYGDTESDTLSGGNGADRFIFDDGHLGTTADDTDRITDFSHEEGDRISLRSIDADSTTGGDQDFIFIGEDGFTGNAGEVRFAIQGGNTMVQMDTDGDGMADLYLMLVGEHALVQGDFAL